ncbi:DUF2490 domain-containing protein [Chitinophagaceae bacterium LWZ2-11]
MFGKSIYTKVIFSFVLMLACISEVRSQANDKLGGWDILDVFYAPTKKYTVWFETQTRAETFAGNFYYHEFKGGLFYNLPNTNSFFLGTGAYTTYSPDGNYKAPTVTNEFRIWQQFIVNNNYSHLKIEHRYRFEERWINGDFKIRIRYRINPVIALNKPKVGPKTAYISIFDEIFFGNHAPYFERNRFFAGAGYQFNKLIAVQSGFIRQFDYNKITDGSGKNFIQTTVLFYLDKKTFRSDTHPNMMD